MSDKDHNRIIWGDESKPLYVRHAGITLGGEQAMSTEAVDIKIPATVELCEWETDPVRGKPYVTVKQGRLIREILSDLLLRLQEKGLSDGQWLTGAEEYFDMAVWLRLKNRDARWPVDCDPFCYVQKGGNEGWYVHIDAAPNVYGKEQAADAVEQGELLWRKHHCIAFGKTFDRDAAYRLAAEIGKILEW